MDIFRLGVDVAPFHGESDIRPCADCNVRPESPSALNVQVLRARIRYKRQSRLGFSHGLKRKTSAVGHCDSVLSRMFHPSGNILQREQFLEFHTGLVLRNMTRFPPMPGKTTRLVPLRRSGELEASGNETLRMFHPFGYMP